MEKYRSRGTERRKFKTIIGVLTIIILLLFLVIGWFALRGTTTNTNTSPLPNAPQLRVYDGVVQWLNGAVWQPVTELTALASTDPFETLVSEVPTSPLFFATVASRAGGSVTARTTTTTNKKPSTGGGSTTPPPSGGGGSTPTPTPTPPPGGGDTDIEWTDDIL